MRQKNTERKKSLPWIWHYENINVQWANIEKTVSGGPVYIIYESLEPQEATSPYGGRKDLIVRLSLQLFTKPASMTTIHV